MLVLLSVSRLVVEIQYLHSSPSRSYYHCSFGVHGEGEYAFRKVSEHFHVVCPELICPYEQLCLWRVRPQDNFERLYPHNCGLLSSEGAINGRLEFWVSVPFRIVKCTMDCEPFGIRRVRYETETETETDLLGR
jgi:hypothetical protein